MNDPRGKETEREPLAYAFYRYARDQGDMRSNKGVGEENKIFPSFGLSPRKPTLSLLSTLGSSVRVHFVLIKIWSLNRYCSHGRVFSDTEWAHQISLYITNFPISCMSYSLNLGTELYLKFSCFRASAYRRVWFDNWHRVTKFSVPYEVVMGLGYIVARSCHVSRWCHLCRCCSRRTSRLKRLKKTVYNKRPIRVAELSTVK